MMFDLRPARGAQQAAVEILQFAPAGVGARHSLVPAKRQPQERKARFLSIISEKIMGAAIQSISPSIS
jgi:hypothetical protein